jgi:hypothetical protein
MANGCDGKSILQSCKETILISLKVFDETASIRVLLYSNNFVDLPQKMLDQLSQGVASDDCHKIKQINELISQIHVGSVLSAQNASAVLVNNCVSGSHSPVSSRSLHIVMNLDNKYSKLQVYNKTNNE